MVLINGLLRGSYDYSYYLERQKGIVELDHVYLFDLRVLLIGYVSYVMVMVIERLWFYMVI